MDKETIKVLSGIFGIVTDEELERIYAPVTDDEIREKQKRFFRKKNRKKL